MLLITFLLHLNSLMKITLNLILIMSLIITDMKKKSIDIYMILIFGLILLESMMEALNEGNLKIKNEKKLII